MTSVSPEGVVEVRDYLPSDVVMVDPSRTLGVIVCGMAQAGKTTLTDLLRDTWLTFDPDGDVLRYATSNGFRGLTYRIVEQHGLDLESSVDEELFRTLLAEYVAATDVGSTLYNLYENPPAEELLRNPAVDSIVAVVGEDAVVRPLANGAAGDHLGHILRDPKKDELLESPGLVVLDTRNRNEGAQKFRAAGVHNIGVFVLTCSVETIASRKPGTDIAGLKRRNWLDRTRALGPMTLPEDFRSALLVDEIIHADNSNSRASLVEAGVASVEGPDTAIVFRTDRLTIEEERLALDALLNGMLMVAYRY